MAKAQQPDPEARAALRRKALQETSMAVLAAGGANLMGSLLLRAMTAD